MPFPFQTVLAVGSQHQFFLPYPNAAQEMGPEVLAQIAEAARSHYGYSDAGRVTVELVECGGVLGYLCIVPH